MSSNPYLAFLPADRRGASHIETRESEWSWHDHRVHVVKASRPQAAVRVIVVHGAGGHSGALWPLAALLTEQGVDVTAVDLPLYGRTASPRPRTVRYGDWVRLLSDFVAAERDDRPLILFGASIGGMLAYEVAATSPSVAAVAATCLLDPRDWRARTRMTRFGPLGMLAGPLSVLARGPLATTMIPMRWVANLSKMSRNPELSRMCAADPLGGGASVPLGFLASYLRYRHVSPESMTVPVLLVHPDRDEWTPVALSTRVLRRTAAPTQLVLLRECGHFPIEEPGLTDLADAMRDLVNRLASDLPASTVESEQKKRAT